MTTPATQSSIIVKKFGGTSVGSIERIENVADRIHSDTLQGQKPIIVASAMSGETNRLVRLANDINPRYRGSAYDMLLASGEQVSIALLAIALEKRGLNALPLLAHQIGIQTDSIYSKAKIQSIDSGRLMGYVNEGIVPVVAGFQGVDMQDRITTLGRGGSDTTAVAIAAAISTDLCEIYTDVPAVFSADPRLVSKAREIKEMCFEEMMEMASLGSKVLHFRCVELAAKYKIKIHVRSTFEKREGTLVVPEEKAMENPVVNAVTHENTTTVFKVYPVPFGAKLLAELFTELAEKGVIVDVITQSQIETGQRLAFSANADDTSVAKEIIDKIMGKEVNVEVHEGMAKVAIVGVGMRNHPGVAARFFSSLDRAEVALDLVSTSDISITAIVDKNKLQSAAESLHTEFGLDVVEAQS